MGDSGELQNVLHAITALYHHDDRNIKEQANRWLQAWQRTPAAWSTSDLYLHNNRNNMEADYFMAQTLKLKVQRDFEELPSAAALQLRDSLLQLLVGFCQGSPPVRTQLCIALAACAAHLPAPAWGQQGVLGWLRDMLGQQPRPIALSCLLEMLVVLPQEASSYSVSIRPDRRRQLLEEVKQQLPLALQLLSACLAENSELVPQVLEAFAAWVKLAGLPDSDAAALCSHPLVGAALHGLNRHGHFDVSVEALVEVLSALSQGGKPLQQHGPLAAMLTQHVVALRPRFLVVAQRLQAERDGTEVADEAGANHDDDEETAKGMARLFAEAAEGFVALVAAGSAEVMPMVELMLDVAGFPDDTICAMSFNFWTALSYELTGGREPQDIDEPQSLSTAISPEERGRRIALFVPVFERLVLLIRGRVRYPSSYDTWHHDERADFKRSRYAIGDTLLDAGSILDSTRLLSLLIEPLQALSAVVASGGQFDWRAAEAALYCLRAVHRVRPPPRDPLLTALFGSLAQLPPVPSLQYTAALMVGSYSGWLDASLQQGMELATVLELLQMLVTGFGHNDTAPAATLALCNVCEACAGPLTAAMPMLGGLYQQVVVGGEGMLLQEQEVQQVMEAVCNVAARMAPEQQAPTCTALMAPISQALAQLLAPNGAGPDASALACQLDRMAIVFRFITWDVQVARLLQEAWPQLTAVLDGFGADERVVEHTTRCLRYALRNAGKHSLPLLPQLLDTLPRRFATQPHSSYLYVASEVIKIYGDEPARAGDLGVLLGGLLRAALGRLRGLKDFDKDPELADDVFLLSYRTLNYCPGIVTTPEILPLLMDSALHGMLVQHREANSSILTFLNNLLDPALLKRVSSQGAACLSDTVGPRLGALLRVTLAGVVGALPPAREELLADVLFATLQALHTTALSALTEALRALPEVAVSDSDRGRFLEAANSVASGAGDRRAMLEAVEELSEVCRRNRRARDAAQLALLPQELHWVVAS